MEQRVLLFLACILITVSLADTSLYQEQQRAASSDGAVFKQDVKASSPRIAVNATIVQKYFKCFANTSVLDNVPLCRGFISAVVIGLALIVLAIVLMVCIGVCVYKQCCSKSQSNRQTSPQIQSPRRLFSGSTSSSSGSLRSQTSNDDTTPLLGRASTNVKVKKQWTLFGQGSKADTTGIVLASTAAYQNTKVPYLVVVCVREIERKGLTSEGLYRRSGSLKTIRELKESLLHNGKPALDRVDVIVLCGVVKDFLRSLREPILTFNLRERFIQAVASDSDDDLHSVITQLPQVNKDTLSFLILHLQRVASHSDANKMDKTNLATVLGPTIVGHNGHDSSPLTENITLQIKVVQRLLDISGDYWWQYTSLASESLLNK